MCVLMLACDHSITIEQVAKLLVIDEFKLMNLSWGSGLKISSTKSNIYHSKRVKLFTLVFNFLHRPFILWRWIGFVHFITMLSKCYDV